MDSGHYGATNGASDKAAFLSGGKGADTFFFLEAFGNDVISDFDVSSEFLSMGGYVTALSELTIRATSDAASTEIEINKTGEKVLLLGVEIDDFVPGANILL